MPELTDLSVIRALCEKYDFALSKGFGQNFIINPGLPPKIVDASGVDKRYGVIEIGPGIGVLTKELAKRAAKVVSIEVDERLPPLLAETMAGVDNFKLVLNDVLKVDLKALLAESAEVNRRMADTVSALVKGQDTFAAAGQPLPNYEVPVPKDSPLIGKSIGELKFWQSTGGTIVAIRRGQTVILSPGPYAELYSGDVIILVGSPSAAEAAHRLVTTKE